MADLLVEQGALDPAGRALLVALTDRHLRAPDDDPNKSLAGLDVNRSTRESLAAADGPGPACDQPVLTFDSGRASAVIQGVEEANRVEAHDASLVVEVPWQKGFIFFRSRSISG